MNQENRIVVLIDMDCFYCQVEEKLDPNLKGKPIAVVQYNPWKGGGIIAVNYVAREMGVTRHMRGDEAKEKCPEIQLPSVPCQRGKADTTKYREAGKEVARVLQKFSPLLERASVDEAYLDITTVVQDRLKKLSIHSITNDMLPNTYALGYDTLNQFLNEVQNYGNESIDFDLEHAKQLVIGAVIVSEIRTAVYNETGYQCSAGIAHNKILAKLVCGMNKPNKQTVLPKHSINILYRTLPIKKVKSLGGKFGENVCNVLKITKMCELQKFSERELQTKFDEKNGSWLYNIACGVDLEPVQARFNPKSIGCCKQLRGNSALLNLFSLKKWLKDLSDEIEDRLEKDALENNRSPKQMVVSFSSQLANAKDVSSSSRSYNFGNEDELCCELFYTKALELIMESTEGTKPKDNEENRRLSAPIKFLGISVGKFEDNSDIKKTKKIQDYFGAGTSKVNNDNNVESTLNENGVKLSNNTGHSKRNFDKDYIMEKFFQVSENKNFNTETKETPIEIENKQTGIEANLDKQESFFARFLNGANTQNSTNDPNKNLDSLQLNNDNVRPATAMCNIVECGSDSTTSDYSHSTINMEINKSISLFEDVPTDTTRVGNMRNLLSNSVKLNKDYAHSESMTDENSNFSELSTNSPFKMESITCPECGKSVLLNLVETHSDYHLALKLRDEDREMVRTEKSNAKENIQKVNVSSMENFIVKLDSTVATETCRECGKRVPSERFGEHLDFHEAQRLSRQLNQKSTKSCSTSTASIKRKHIISSPTKKSKIPNRSIDSFFR